MSSVKGLEKLIKALEKAPKELEGLLEAAVEDNAQNIVKDARLKAPIDTGKLRQSINAYRTDDLTYRVGANTTGLAPYAPYIEFGTGGKVDVPAELREIANRFRGRGIRQVNLRARPFLYPALLAGRERFIKDIERLTAKYFGDI